MPKERAISDQAVQIAEFAAQALMAAEQLRIKTEPLDNFWLAPGQQEVLLLIPSLSNAIKNKLAKEKPLTVAEVASMTMAVAEDLPLGFDVLSFDELDESERLIEVKTTGLGKYFPFYVTANELRCSEDVERQFNLYRVFDFARTPRLFVLRGSLRGTCRLEAVQFRATI